MPKLPPRKELPAKQPPRFRDRDAVTDEWEITSHGGHRINRGGQRQRRDDEGQWVFVEDPPDVEETDPHPSNPRQAGQSAGEFIGGLVDGVRKNVSPGALLAIAALLGLGGGLGGHEFASSMDPAPTEAQVDVLLRAIQKQNLELADMERRIQMLEIARDLVKRLPEVTEAALAAKKAEVEVNDKVVTENAALEEQLKGAGK